jgi:hypothetical protein
MKRYCKGCGGEIPTKRIEILPNTKFCVECSQDEKKQALTIQVGEGDHIYNDIIIMDAKDLRDLSPEDFDKEQTPEVVDYEVEDQPVRFNLEEGDHYQQPDEENLEESDGFPRD